MRHYGFGRIVCACLACAFGMALAGTPAAARAITVFDFNDFPDNPGGSDPGAVNTTVYGCRGKNFCTNEDISDARDNAISSISTTRDGIEATFARPPLGFPAGVGVFPDQGPGYLNPGNVEGTGDYVPYVVDFSRELLFTQVSVALGGESGLGDFAFLEIWSDPGATGTLLGRTVEAPGELSIGAPQGSSFRSIKFGIGWDIPGCESGCWLDDDIGEQGTADDIRVEPVPEPSAAVVFATGLLIVARQVRRGRGWPSLRSGAGRG